jgi:hypothetical protein
VISHVHVAPQRAVRRNPRKQANGIEASRKANRGREIDTPIDRIAHQVGEALCNESAGLKCRTSKDGGKFFLTLLGH